MPEKNGNHLVFSQDQKFWQNYIQGRPQVPDSFFARIINYHAEHGGFFDTVHDAGAGAGVHSPRLAEHFKHIIVSDIAEQNIIAARSRLQPNPNSQKRCTFLTTRLQDASPSVADSTVDLYFSSSALHFCGKDLDAAIEVAARQLKPGGTYCAALLGMANFPEEPELQRSWTTMFQQFYGNYLSARSTTERVAKMDTLVVCASAYDAIALPEDLFDPGAIRLKINHGDQGWWRAMQMPFGRDDEVEVLNRIGANDDVRTETDEGFKFEMDIESLTKHLETFPQLRSVVADELWTNIERIVGQRTIAGVWPVSVVLATRKK